MSYILDALKKSERERGHGNIPDVQTVHSSSLNYRNEKRAYWPYILITAVILNLFAIIYFFTNKENQVDPPTIPQQPVVATPVESNNTVDKPKSVIPIVVTNDNNTPEIKQKPVNTDKTTSKKAIEQAVETKPVAADTSKQTISSDTEILEFFDLPESIKQDLPAIVISAHVYSTNPLQRSIVINNKFLEEGEYVLDGLILIEITPNGAIFNYQGTMFSYGVVSGWQ